MALLRNREVQILRVATEVDGSTFVVRYPDAETEMAKMNELIFTPAEYDAFVRTQLPEVQVMDQKDINARKELTRPEVDKKVAEDAKKAEESRPESVKPVLKPMNTDQSKPSTYPDNHTAPKKV